MSTNLDVIHAFIIQSPRDVTSRNLRYDAYRKSIFSYSYRIGYWLYVPNKSDFYAVIRAHDGAPSKTTAEHMNTLNMRSACIRSVTLPILISKLFDELPNCKGEQGWDFSYFALYRTYAAKAARTRTQFYFDEWKRQMATVVESLDKIATTFGWSYDRHSYTPEFALQNNPKLIEQYAMRDMGVWN